MFYVYVFVLITYILFLNFECCQSTIKLSLDIKDAEKRYINNASWLTERKKLFGKNPICLISNEEKKQICRELFEIHNSLGKFIDSNDDLICVGQQILLDSAFLPAIELEEYGYPCHHNIFKQHVKKWITQGDKDTIYMLSNIDSNYRLGGYVSGMNIPTIHHSSLITDNLETEISVPPPEMDALITFSSETDISSTEIIAPTGINNNLHHSTLDTYYAELEYISSIPWRTRNTGYSICVALNTAKLATCAKIFQIYIDIGIFDYETEETKCETRTLRVCLQKSELSDCEVFSEEAYPCYGRIQNKREKQWIIRANQDTILLLNKVNDEFRLKGYATGISVNKYT